jgi:hypothetical protein
MLAVGLLAVSGGSLLAAPKATVTTLAVTAGGKPATAVVSGTVVTLTATVKAGTNLVKPGRVRFCDSALNAFCEGSARLGAVELTSAAGQATFKLRLGLGNHSISAEFVGTSSYAPSTSAASPLAVQGEAASSTQLKAVPTDGTGSYELKATVAAQGAGALGWPPTGTVIFPDGGNGGKSLGTATLTPGSGGYQVSFQEFTYVGDTLSAVADLNGDGYPDGLVSFVDNGNAFAYSVLGNGTGTFSFVSYLPQIPAGAAYRGMNVSDFNGDGILDVLEWYATPVTGGNTFTFEVLLGKGDGTFTASTAYTPLVASAGATDPLVGDFNSDGILDVIAPTAYSGTGSSAVATLSLYAGNGDGTFATPVSLGTGLPFLAAVDVNNDGKLDLMGPDGSDDAVVALGNGDGSFQTPIVSTAPTYRNYHGTGALIADFNGDGNLDVVGFDGVTLILGLGNGDGTFTQVLYQNFNSAGNGGSNLYTADMNGDGFPDLFQFSPTGGVFVYLNNGDGTFRGLPLADGGSAGEGTSLEVAADFNGDGLPDLVAYRGNQGGGAFGLLNTGGWVSQAVSPAITLAPGSGKHPVEARFGGDAGTMMSSSSEPTPLWAPKLATTLGLKSSATTVAPGGTVTLTATLAPFSSGSLSSNGEQVGFYRDGALLGFAPLAGGVATLTTGLPGGTDALTAEYSGDNSFNGAVSTVVNVTIPQTATKLTLATSNSSTTAFASPGTVLTATLTPSSNATEKTDGEVVTFLNGDLSLGTGVLSGGVAKLTTGLPAGTDAITAVYGGDEYFGVSISAPKTVTVTKEKMALTLSAGLTTISVGTSLTLTATLKAATPAAYPNFSTSVPQESVWFYSGTVLLGSAIIPPSTVAGQATISISTTALPLGVNKVTAVYTGDGTFQAVTSAAQTITVNKVASTVTLKLQNPCAQEGCSFVYPGENVTLLASLTSSSGYALPAGEPVKFFNGTTLLGAGTLTGTYATGCASLPCAFLYLPSLPAGTLHLTAEYAGDSLFAAEVSKPYDLVVAKAVTTTTLSVNSSGSSVALQAFTTSANGDNYFNKEAGADSVSFYDGSKLLGTATFLSTPVGSGRWSADFGASSLASGTHSFTAVFAGDSAYQGSSSSAVKATLPAAAAGKN